MKFDGRLMKRFPVAVEVSYKLNFFLFDFLVCGRSEESLRFSQRHQIQEEIFSMKIT